MDILLIGCTIVWKLKMGSGILLLGIIVLGFVAIVFCDKKYATRYFEKFIRGGSL